MQRRRTGAGSAGFAWARGAAIVVVVACAGRVMAGTPLVQAFEAPVAFLSGPQ